MYFYRVFYISLVFIQEFFVLEWKRGEKLKKVILLLFLSLKIVIASELTPLNFDKKIDEGVVSKEYILKNSSDKIIKYSVYMEKS